MNKRKKSKVGLLVMAGILVYFGFLAVDQQKKLDSMDVQMQQLRQKMEDEQKVNEELKKKKQILNTDEYVEKIAREELGMIKPGERIFEDINDR